MSQNMLDGGQVIVDYLVREKVPYVFGLCGHGNIGFIDALYERSDEIKTISVHHETVAGFMADVYYRVGGRADRDLHLLRPGLGQPADRARQLLSRFRAVPGGDRQRADEPVQPRRVPGALPALPGRLSLHRARLLQARVPAHPRRHGAARDPPGVEDDGDRTARAGRARRSVRHLQGGGRRGNPEAGGVERQHLVALRRRSRGRQARRVDMLLAAERPVILVGQGVKYGGAAADLLRSRSDCAFRSPGRRAARAPSIPITRWRSASSPATAPIRPTTPRARPTCCSRSACASTTAHRARGCRAIPSRSRRPGSFMSTSTRTRSPATIRSRSG